VDDYGDGLYRLRHVKLAYQGRLIFFAVDRAAGFERLVVLTVYKKQTQKVPARVLETAKRRKKQWEEARKKR
jgi:phage-related protein